MIEQRPMKTYLVLLYLQSPPTQSTVSWQGSPYPHPVHTPIFDIPWEGTCNPGNRWTSQVVNVHWVYNFATPKPICACTQYKWHKQTSVKRNMFKTFRDFLRAMASILQNLFVRALNPESVRSLKMVMSHASLYLGIILYTAVGAKVVQLLYFYSFCCWWQWWWLVMNHASLYLGIILYTAVGAKVFFEST